jgi:hypothetical protein
MFMKMRRARFFAQFILSGQSEILRCAQDDSEGLSRKWTRKLFGFNKFITRLPRPLSGITDSRFRLSLLRMTAGKRFPAACEAASRVGAANRIRLA